MFYNLLFCFTNKLYFVVVFINPCWSSVNLLLILSCTISVHQMSAAVQLIWCLPVSLCGLV